MPDTIYVYKDHQITGPNNYSVNIIASDHGKNITLEGSENLTLTRHGKKYLITHNFMDDGYVEKNSIMEYHETEFYMDNHGMSYLKNGKINLDIYHENDQVGYVAMLKDSLSIYVEDEDYILPVIIYVSVLSKSLKSKFGKIYFKRNIIQIPMMVITSSLFGVAGISVFKSFIFYALIIMVAFSAQFLLALLIKGRLF